MLKKHFSLFILIFNLSLFSLFSSLNPCNANEIIEEKAKDLKVISLAPSTTETISALGLEKSLIGISSYCQITENISSTLPRLGTAKFFSAEAVLALKPDFVFGIEKEAPEHIPYISVPSQSLQDALNAFLIISKVYNVENKGIKLYNEYKAFIEEKKQEFSQKPRKKVLFVMDAVESSNGVVNKVVAAGNDGYFSELLTILNAQNAVESDIAYPVLSFEMIYKMNPDVVIEIHPIERKHLFSFENWKNTPIKAVTDKKIFLSHNGLVPGPRVKIFLEEMANFLN